MIGWRHEETESPLASRFIRNNTQREQPTFSSVPRTGADSARPPTRSLGVLRKPRRRQTPITEAIAGLVSALYAATSEADACQTAVDGLQAVLPGFEVGLQLSAAFAPPTPSAATDGARGQRSLPDTRQHGRQSAAAHGRYFGPRNQSSADSPPIHLARLSIPVVVDGEVLGQLIVGRLAGGSAFDTYTSALSQTTAGTLAQMLGYLRLRAQLHAAAHASDSPATAPASVTAEAASRTQGDISVETWAASAFDAMTEGVLIMDAQAHVVVANATLRQWFAIQHDPIGTHGAAVLEQIERCLERSEQEFAPASAPVAGSPSAQCEVFQQIAPASRIVERRTLPLLTTDGRRQGTVTIYRDITSAYNEWERRNTFLTSVAHELRTPLTCITGHTQLLAHRIRRQAEPDAEPLTGDQWQQLAVRPLQAIQRQIKRMNRLLGDVLDASRLDEGILQLHIEETDAVTLAESVIDDLRTMTRVHQVTLEAPATMPLRCDPDRVEQIIYNLLSNAIKYSPHGGEVHVALRVDDSETPCLALTVTDQGVGIPADESESIFERYTRATTPETLRTAGVGLGLHISRVLAHRHGGALRILSAGGPGTTFELRLPLAGPEC